LDREKVIEIYTKVFNLLTDQRDNLKVSELNKEEVERLTDALKHFKKLKILQTIQQELL